MKDYKQFIKTLPNSTIVCALGDFNPPTTTHELLVKTVQVVSEQRKADHIIFTSPSNILQEEKKHQFLKLMFPKANVISIGESFFSTTVKKLNEKYKKVVIIAGADQFDEFKKLKESTSIEIISIGTKDPDADFPKMKQFATKGLYEDFKKLLPSTIRDIDGKRLMNEMRIGMNLEPIKEQLVLVKDKLREDYFNGKIFNVGDIVESKEQLFEIVKRGSNHLLVKDQTGNLVSKWITDVKEAVIQPNGTDKIDPNAKESEGTNQVQKPKGKVKGFLTFYNYDDNKKTVKENKTPLDKPTLSAQEIAAKHGLPVDHILKQIEIGSKIEHEHTKEQKAAEEIARDHLGERPDYYARLKKYVEEVGLDETRRMSAAEKLQRAFKREQEKSAASRERAKKLLNPTQDRPGMGTENKPYNDPFSKEEFEFSDDEINNMVESVDFDMILELYDEDELVLIYEDTGEEVPVCEEESQIDLMEVLSRQERMRAKFRFRRSKAKRERSTKIALKRHSNVKVINARARRLAVRLMKQRLLRGVNYKDVGIGDKERIDRTIKKRKVMIDRLAAKLVSRVRNVEKSRMSHEKVTKQNTQMF